MTFTSTEEQLSRITDEGFFEKLATSVLREAAHEYRAIVHTGVNAAGKTIKSPVDGIIYRTDTDPPHLYLFHHTTTAVAGLRNKWLREAATVNKRRRTGKATADAPEGDLPKALGVIAEERRKNPNLRATVVLSTNQEPDADLVRDVAAAGQTANVITDIWNRSRLAHLLDTTGAGHWLRRTYLGLPAQLVSRQLLSELSEKSLSIHKPRDPVESWVDREMDHLLVRAARREVTFLIAASGQGKTIAAYKWLSAHVASDKPGLILPHEIIAGALTLADAIDATLRQLHPDLAPGAGTEALALCSPEYPLNLVVEDINRSGQAILLAERIEAWSRNSKEGSTGSPPHYRVICSLWPEILVSMSDGPRKAIASLAIYGSSFTKDEGRLAVEKRAALAGHSISPMTAEGVATALGCDPLLIALHDPAEAATPDTVIGQFVDGVLERVARRERDYAAANYRQSLRLYARAALEHRVLDPLWTDVSKWLAGSSDDLRRLMHLIHDGSLVHLAGSSAEQRVGYRHDRVRDWLLIDAASQLASSGELSGTVTQEPYFAEIVGAVIGRGYAVDPLISRVRVENPLALFHALRLLSQPTTSNTYKKVIAAIDEWLSSSSLVDPSCEQLRWNALSALAHTDGPDVIRIVSRFNECGWPAWQARFRNGDISAAIEMCVTVEPGSTAPWRDIQIAHAKHKFGKALTRKIDEVLRVKDLTAQIRVGTLRLAGLIADPTVCEAIRVCWEQDADHDQHLADYLWAFAECFGENGEKYLQDVCDAWAKLPTAREDADVSGTREDLAAHEVRWAFRKWVPKEAIPYFVKRAAADDLRWPITYMLSEIDDPKAVRFVAEEIAATLRRIEGTNNFSPFAHSLVQNWRYREENVGIGMSDVSREALRALWTDPVIDKHLRKAAFRLWAAIHSPSDLTLLRDPTLPVDLSSDILHARLLRADNAAVPELLEQIKESKNPAGWWHMMRHVWSDRLTGVLDLELERRASAMEATWQSGNDTDYATSDLIMRSAPEVGEALLKKHWTKLQYIPNFGHAALYLATAQLQELIAKTMSTCPGPKTYLKYFGMHAGFKTSGHPGITRPAQVSALAPYLQYMANHEISELSEICNDQGWFDLRRSILDPHLRANAGGILYEDEEPTFRSLDEMLKDNRVGFLDFWLERYTKTGASADQIFSRLGKWLDRRRTFGSLDLVCRALVQLGRRSDLNLLTVVIEPENAHTSALRADTTYAVKRRSIH